MFTDVNAFIAELEQAAASWRASPTRSIRTRDRRRDRSRVEEPGGGPASAVRDRPHRGTMPSRRNIYGSMSRICLALGVTHLDELAKEIDELTRRRCRAASWTR
jgi:hypothetical protein